MSLEYSVQKWYFLNTRKHFFKHLSMVYRNWRNYYLDTKKFQLWNHEKQKKKFSMKEFDLNRI